jgi:hypothetical protein
MSKTISFVATDELAEYLEAEAERRMTSISSTAQMLLAEKVREDRQREQAGNSQRGAEGTDWGENPKDLKTDQERMEELEEMGFFDEDSGEYPILEAHSDAWYKPNSDKHDYAVEVPEGAGTYDEGETRYYKTANGAAQALRRWYE